MKPDSDAIDGFNARRPRGAEKVLCHAPFKSIFFNVRGRMNVCCYNKHYSLGTYPEQSLKEMWFGKKADALRNSMRKNDLSLGCNYCYFLFEGGNYSSLPAKNFDQLAWNKEGYPTKIDFELSNVCNLECLMCKGELSSSIRKNRDLKAPMPQVYGPEFLQEIREFIPYLQNSHFLGGEPFLIPVYFDLWEMMIELNPGIEISIQTNATVLNQKVKGILGKIKANLAISMDSFVKETYEQIRLNAKFERVMENISWFRDYCQRMGTFISFSFCPMVQNWRELPDVIKQCNDWDADVFFNTVYHPYECSLLRLSGEKLGEIIEYLENVDLPLKTGRGKGNLLRYQDMISLLKDWETKARSRESLFGENSQELVSMDHFYNNLSRFIEREGELSGNEGIFEDMQEKIEFVVNKARAAGYFELLWKQIKSSPLEMMCREIPMFPKEQLYSMFLETVE